MASHRTMLKHVIDKICEFLPNTIEDNREVFCYITGYRDAYCSMLRFLNTEPPTNDKVEDIPADEVNK